MTVLLSGQGADEILCGYKKYLGFYLQELLRQGSWIRAARVLAGFASRGTILTQMTYSEAKRYLPGYLRVAELDIRGARLRADSTPFPADGAGVLARQVDDIQRLSVPALLHYEDRMSMASSREIRLPFLDYRLVNLLAPLRPELKLREGWTKWVFRQAMAPLLPPEIVWRKDKQGFPVPQTNGLAGELKPAVLRLLGEEWVTESLGLLDKRSVGARYASYLSQPRQQGRLSWKDVFSPIALELWARRFEGHLR